MNPPSKVEIVIYDAPTLASQSGCGCGCGGHDHSHDHSHDHGHGHHDPLEKVSLELQVQALAKTLENDFPQQVSVRYINVLQDPEGPRLPQTTLLCSLAYPTPLVYINGKGRFAGALPVERIRDAVAAALGQPAPR